MKAWIFAAAAMAALVASPAAASTIYVMRHLPKAEGQDPSLTAAGAAQAEQLAELLAAANIKAVFATSTRRARETGEPLAKRLGISISTYDPRDMNALAKAVAGKDGSVLIVGHSNTVPDLVAHFGGERPAPLSEQDYGIIFVVHAASSQTHQIPLAESLP